MHTAPLIDHLANFPHRHPEGFIALIAAIVGAIVTSLSAYWLQRGGEKRRERRDEKGAIIKAQVTLIAQLNTLRILWERHIKPARDLENPEQHIGPIWFTECEPTVDINTIAFLVTRKTPNLVLEIHLAQRSYLSAIDALRVKNALFEDIFVKSKAVTVSPPGQATVVNADPRAVMNHKAATGALLTSFPLAIARCKESIAALRVVGLKRYSSWFSRKFGKDGFLRVEPSPK